MPDPSDDGTRDDVRRLLRDLPVTPLPNPEDAWTAIRAELATPRRLSMARRPVRSPWTVAAAATAALVLGGVAGAYRQFVPPAEWRVAAVDGAPALNGVALSGEGALGVDEWLTTDHQSSARLTVGRIGVAEVGPGSRVRIVRGGFTDHRLVLQQGSLHAVIAAPPRLFFVQTPSALATDLGCAYTLDVDSLGGSRLRVTAGWVELERDGRRSLVPAGLAADVLPGGAPGTPYDPALPDSTRAALRRLDTGAGSDADLARVLAAMAAPTDLVVLRQASGITLWHLVQRLEGAPRDRVIARLAALSPPPPQVTMEGIRALDRRMLDRWRRELSPMWAEEAAPLWATLGRRLWMWAMG